MPLKTLFTIHSFEGTLYVDLAQTNPSNFMWQIMDHVGNNKRMMALAE
jgi:hypothetical protein